MDFRYKPLYLEFPIFQIAYILFWIPIGFIVSNILSTIVVSVVFHILATILGAIFSLTFEMFVISGRMQAMVQPYYFLATIFFDFMLLIIGLELISCFLNKKRREGGFDEHSSDGQN